MESAIIKTYESPQPVIVFGAVQNLKNSKPSCNFLVTRMIATMVLIVVVGEIIIAMIVIAVVKLVVVVMVIVI